MTPDEAVVRHTLCVKKYDAVVEDVHGHVANRVYTVHVEDRKMVIPLMELPLVLEGTGPTRKHEL